MLRQTRRLFTAVPRRTRQPYTTTARPSSHLSPTLDSHLTEGGPHLHTYLKGPHD